MKSLIMSTIAVLLASIAFAAAPEVSNVCFSQRLDGSKIIDIYYDLFDADDEDCFITLRLSNNNGTTYSILPSSGYLSGDVGPGVNSGFDKHIMWNAGMESFFCDGNSYRFKVIADDGTAPELPPDFVYIPARTFTRGRTSGYGDVDEIPPHLVSLSAYAISKFEVTQSQWSSIMGYNPASGYGVGASHPVYHVSWYAIIKYCNLRSISEGLTPAYRIEGVTDPDKWGDVPAYDVPAWNAVVCDWNANGYRLPTDAEWEFAARAGTNNPDYLYSGSDDIGSVAWFIGNNSPFGSKPVGTKAPNALGIYDMSGNLWEYCWDWQSQYLGIAETNPTGPETGVLRIARGGHWQNYAQQCRVYERSGYYAYEGSYWMGFRLAKSIGPISPK